MKIYNLSNIDEVFLAKQYIEKILLDENKINEKLELQEFILSYMNVSKKVYLKNDNIIPFEYYKLNEEDIIIITDDNHKDDITKALSNINFDLSSLSYMSNNQLNNIFLEDNYECFIINSKYMK